MPTQTHRGLRELLGAYALGQLGESERSEVDQHLRDCLECQAELRDLEPAATALRRVDRSALAEPEPPADLGDRILAGIHDRRRAAFRSRTRRGVLGVLVAASVAAAFAVGAGYVRPGTEPPLVAVALRLDQPGVAATAGLVKHTWGTELKLDASGLTDGASYTVTFVKDDGSRVDAGSFLGTGAKPLQCSVNAALPLDAAAEVDVTDASGHLVLDAKLR